jgi:hypothetical protein
MHIQSLFMSHYHYRSFSYTKVKHFALGVPVGALKFMTTEHTNCMSTNSIYNPPPTQHGNFTNDPQKRTLWSFIVQKEMPHFKLWSKVAVII